MLLVPPNATPTLSLMGAPSAVKNSDGSYTVSDPLDCMAMLTAGWVKVDIATDTHSSLASSLKFNTAAGSQYLPLIF